MYFAGLRTSPTEVTVASIFYAERGQNACPAGMFYLAVADGGVGQLDEAWRTDN
jgi:hypothetical protein